MSERILIHCDLDAFYAAVETIHHNLDPQVPLIIGSDPKGGQGRGIVSTCNYAAREYGVRSAMPIVDKVSKNCISGLSKEVYSFSVAQVFLEITAVKVEQSKKKLILLSKWQKN